MSKPNNDDPVLTPEQEEETLRILFPDPDDEESCLDNYNEEALSTLRAPQFQVSLRGVNIDRVHSTFS
ncbi:MAG: hypothetical protein IJQ59_07140 [Bacteroidaceae bacterium]|nr:hypothetical protein [Bacteroidaceae bacterium]